MKTVKVHNLQIIRGRNKIAKLLGHHVPVLKILQLIIILWPKHFIPYKTVQLQTNYHCMRKQD